MPSSSALTKTIETLVDELVAQCGAGAYSLKSGAHQTRAPQPEAWESYARLEPLLPDRVPGPTKVSWPYSLLRCLGTMNEGDAANALVQRWGRSVPAGHVHIAWGACLGGHGELASMRAREHPKDAALAYFVLESALSLGNVALARALLPQADARGHISMAVWLRRNEGASDELWALTQSVTSSEHNWVLHVWLEALELFVERGERERARLALAEARAVAAKPRYLNRELEKRLGQAARGLTKSVASLSPKEVRGLALAHAQADEGDQILALLEARRPSAKRVELGYDVLRMVEDHCGPRASLELSEGRGSVFELIARLARADSLFETRSPEDARAHIEDARARLSQVENKREHAALEKLIERVSAQA